jgi:hypothetical protein
VLVNTTRARPTIAHHHQHVVEHDTHYTSMGYATCLKEGKTCTALHLSDCSP